MSAISRQDYPRRIVVLGDMLELGPQSAKFHEELWEAVDEAGVDLVFASGPNMFHLMQRIPKDRIGAWAQSSKDLEEKLLAILKAGDVVMIKGSNSSQMGLLTNSILKKFAKSS
ncbi:MAG: glutamate ligase domain-containing protein [Hyphomicrobium sp.]